MLTFLPIIIRRDDEIGHCIGHLAFEQYNSEIVNTSNLIKFRIGPVINGSLQLVKNHRNTGMASLFYRGS